MVEICLPGSLNWLKTLLPVEKEISTKQNWKSWKRSAGKRIKMLSMFQLFTIQTKLLPHPERLMHVFAMLTICLTISWIRNTLKFVFLPSTLSKNFFKDRIFSASLSLLISSSYGTWSWMWIQNHHYLLLMGLLKIWNLLQWKQSKIGMTLLERPTKNWE